jgi:PAT family beta-lactamase induction signal transducer AmpG
MREPGGQPDAPPLPPAERPGRKPSDVAWVASTNFGEGLPWSFIHQMGTEFLTSVRAPIEQVGYTSWLHLAVTLKFLWSPIVDLAGRKRTWMVALQVLFGFGMLVLAWVSRGESSALGMFWLVMGVHATHDIACDGYYLLALNRADQALYSGARVAAFRAAMLVGGSWLVALAGIKGWPVGFTVGGIVMTLVGIGNTLFVPRVDEPRVVKPKHASLRERGRAFLEAYRTFFDQPRIAPVLLFILTLKLGDIMMFAMAKPMLRDIGISLAQRGALVTPSIISQIAGAMAAGAIIARWKLERTLIPIIYFMNLAIPLYAVLAWTAPPFYIVIPIVCFEQFAAGMGATVQSVYLMQRARRAFSASHYAFATAITAIGTTFSGAFSGHLYKAVGMRWYFVLCIAFGIPSMILVLLVPRRSVDDTPPSAK